MPRPLRAVQKVRTNLDFHPDIKAKIEELRDRTHADGMGEVVRRAIALYETVLDTQESGGTLLIKPKVGLVREVLVV